MCFVSGLFNQFAQYSSSPTALAAALSVFQIKGEVLVLSAVTWDLKCLGSRWILVWLPANLALAASALKVMFSARPQPASVDLEGIVLSKPLLMTVSGLHTVDEVSRILSDRVHLGESGSVRLHLQEPAWLWQIPLVTLSVLWRPS